MRLLFHRRCRGFTLIELMVAVGILMMVMFAIYSSWTAILRSSQVGMKAAADAQRSRIGMKCLEDALLTAEMFTENVRYYSFQADTTSDPNLASLSLTARLPASFPGSGLFGDQVVRRVTFTVEAGTNGNVLMMRQTPYLMQATEDPYPIPLAQNVTLFVMEFWDTRLNEWATEFVVTNQLPRMIRVSLGTGKRGAYSDEPTEISTRVVAIPGSAITRDMQAPIRPGVPGGGGGGRPGGGNLPPGPGQGGRNVPPGQGGRNPPGLAPGGNLPIQPGRGGGSRFAPPPAPGGRR